MREIEMQDLRERRGKKEKGGKEAIEREAGREREREREIISYSLAFLY